MKNNNTKIKKLMSRNQETNVPNTNSLSKQLITNLQNKPISIITLLINNHFNIIDVLGTNIYHELIYKLYVELTDNLPKGSVVVQSDSNKLWILMPFDEVTKDAHQIFQILTKQKTFNNIPLYIDFSIGADVIENISTFDNLELFQSSDSSARIAQLHKLPYVIYDSTKMKKRTEFELLATFLQALTENQTFLVFQPKMDLKTMKPCSLEALIRWKHPVKGIIFPDSFIPLVEETQLIHTLTDWVFEKTLQEILEMQKRFITMPVSINISGKNINDPKFFGRIMNIIRKYAISPKMIELEVTETILMANPLQSKEMLTQFSDEGFSIAIDDFGKGYSSLAYLSQFPIDTIKIDKFFMKQIGSNNSIRQIVKSTIDLSKQLGYKVVAEGIEDKVSLDFIKEYHCDYAQGYFFSRPVESEEIISWINDKLQ